VNAGPAEEQALKAFADAGVPAAVIGSVTAEPHVSVSCNGTRHVNAATTALRDQWEATSFELERLQSAADTVAQEQAGLSTRTAPKWELTYTPTRTPQSVMEATEKPKVSSDRRIRCSFERPCVRPLVLRSVRCPEAQVAIIREEGSNGDREMAAAMYAAGMEPWDVTMSDLLAGHANLDAFRGCVFVGGFSYADVLDSAKGWAGGIRFNPSVKKQFEDFYNRSDTFSLGVCNGCQLSALLGYALRHASGMYLP